MQGYSFKVDYIKKRSRIRSLFAPIIVLPLFIMLQLWSGPSSLYNIENATNLYSNARVNSSINDSTYHKDILNVTHHSNSNFKDEIKENKKSIAHQDDYNYHFGYDFFKDLKYDTLHDSIVLLKNKFYSWLQSYLDNPLLNVFYYLFFLFIMWAFFIIIFLNISTAFIVFSPIVVLLLCFRKYPSWIFAWNRSITYFVVNTLCYFLLLSPHFPDLEASDEILMIPEPGDKLGRFLPLFKIILVLPHCVILSLLLIIMIPLSFIGYLTTIITGQYPGIIFKFVEGYLRWNYRVICYAQLLCSDQYPQFSFSSRYDDNT